MPEPKAGEVFGGKSDEGKDTQVEMVPKSEVETLKSTHESETKTLQERLKAAERERDEAKLSVLDPDYVAFKESKGKKPDSSESRDDSKVDVLDLDKMPRTQFLETVVAKAVEKATTANTSLQQEIRMIRTTLNNVLADNELKSTAAKYKDFWDYKDEILSQIRQDDGLSFEKAYKIAKQDRITKSEEEKLAAAKAASEKPGGTAADSTSPKTFGNKSAANEDAWDRIVGKDKSTL